jgi:hypothetical protein
MHEEAEHLVLFFAWPGGVFPAARGAPFSLHCSVHQPGFSPAEGSMPASRSARTMARVVSLDLRRRNPSASRWREGRCGHRRKEPGLIDQGPYRFTPGRKVDMTLATHADPTHASV